MSIQKRLIGYSEVGMQYIKANSVAIRVSNKRVTPANTANGSTAKVFVAGLSKIVDPSYNTGSDKYFMGFPVNSANANWVDLNDRVVYGINEVVDILEEMDTNSEQLQAVMEGAFAAMAIKMDTDFFALCKTKVGANALNGEAFVSTTADKVDRLAEMIDVLDKNRLSPKGRYFVVTPEMRTAINKKKDQLDIDIARRDQLDFANLYGWLHGAEIIMSNDMPAGVNTMLIQEDCVAIIPWLEKMPRYVKVTDQNYNDTPFIKGHAVVASGVIYPKGVQIDSGATTLEGQPTTK